MPVSGAEWLQDEGLLGKGGQALLPPARGHGEARLVGERVASSGLVGARQPAVRVLLGEREFTVSASHS